MSEVSKIAEVKNEAWQFYADEKEEEAKLSQAVGDIGNPDYDPNSTQDSTQSS